MTHYGILSISFKSNQAETGIITSRHAMLIKGEKNQLMHIIGFQGLKKKIDRVNKSNDPTEELR